MIARFDNFTRGLTSKINEKNPQFLLKNNNMYVDVNGVLRTRAGSDRFTDITFDGEFSGSFELGERVDPNLCFVAGDKVYQVQDLNFSSNPNRLFNRDEKYSINATSEFINHVYVGNNFQDVPRKIFLGAGGEINHMVAGLRSLSEFIQGDHNKIVSRPVSSFVYEFVLKRTYMSLGRTFVDLSRPMIVQFQLLQEEINVARGGHIRFTLPIGEALEGIREYYGTLKGFSVEIYRTRSDDTTTPYKMNKELILERLNPTSFFLDYPQLPGVSDRALTNNVLPFVNDIFPDPPPQAKYMDIAEGVALYGNTREFPNRVWQSLSSNPDAVPNTFFTDLDSEITAIKSYDFLFHFVFTRKSVYRVTSYFSDNGSGNLSFRKIYDVDSAIHQNAVTIADGTMYFLGFKGVYISKGDSVVRISEHIEELHRDIVESTNPDFIKSTYDQSRNNVLFLCPQVIRREVNNQTLVEKKDLILVYDTLHQGYSTWDGLDIQDLIVFEKELLRFSQNRIFQFDDRLAEDEVFIGDSAFRNSVNWQFRTVNTSLNLDEVQKYIPDVSCEFSSKSTFSSYLRAYNDQSEVPRECNSFSKIDKWIWRVTPLLWRITRLNWREQLKIRAQKRGLPARDLRAKTISIELGHEVNYDRNLVVRLSGGSLVSRDTPQLNKGDYI